MSEKTVFISYRRDAAGKAFARSVKEALTHHGYDAFLDVDDIDAGYWAKQILTQVPQRAHFLLLVTPGALDKCAKQGDWVRREFELAKAHGRNIVPVFEESVDLAKLRKECPKSMKDIFDFQGLTLRHGEFEHGIETLIARYIPPHKAPVIDGQVNKPPVDIKPPDDNKPPILLIALLILILVALAVGLVIIIKSSLFDADLTVQSPVTRTTPKPPESITLVLDDVNEIEADNTHIIKLSPPEREHLSHLTNMSGERERFTLINFPENVFYTNLEDEDHFINAGESKSLRLILIALAPKLKEYPFEIRSVKHKESIRVNIRLEGDWKVYHQQQLEAFAEKTMELKTKEQVYQAALQVIDKETPDLEEGRRQALTGQFLVNAGQTDAAVLAFDEAKKKIKPTPESRDFEAFNLSWHVWKGNPSVSPSEIRLDGPADIQTNKNYRSHTFIATVKSKNWAPDTSIGFDIWAPDRYSIRVSSGKLIIGTSGVDSYEEEIPGWSILPSDIFLTIKIVWQDQNVQLYINDQLKLEHTGSDVPTRPLNVRLNAAHGDVLTLKNVEVLSATR